MGIATEPSRREFLRQASRIAAAAWVAGCDGRGPGGSDERAEIVIAGAGLAGLAAARALVRAGREVVVLEARNRPGGRVLTLREPFGNGLYAEAGAVFVPAHHTHTIEMAREYGIALRRITAGGRGRGGAVHVAGRLIAPDDAGFWPWPIPLHPRERGLSPEALRDLYVTPILAALGDPAHPSWPGEAALAYDGLTFAGLLRTRGASEGAIHLIRLGYVDEWGDGADRISALFLLRELALNGQVDAIHVIDGGSDRLPRAMADALGDRIRYGSTVVGIAPSRGRVDVRYRRERGIQTIRAARLICALPFPVLRMIEGGLSCAPGKRAAIVGARTTSITRIYAEVDGRLDTSAHPWSIPTDLPVMLAADATRAPPGQPWVIEAFLTGARARAVGRMTHADRVAFALPHLERIYPGMRRFVERTASHAWDLEPASRGDYAWFAPGEMRLFLRHLHTAEGRIHFAGDHTSTMPGWMQGALDSGVRAAGEVLASVSR